MRSTARLTDAIRGRKKAVTYFGAAAALLGAGTAGAVTFSAAAHAPAVAAVSQASTARGSVNADKATQEAVADALATAKHAVTHAAPQVAPVKKAAPVRDAAPVKKAEAVKPAAPAKKTAPVKPAAPAKKTAPVNAGPVRGTAKSAAPKAESWTQIEQTVAKQTGSREPQAADHLQPVGTAGPQAWMPLSPAQLQNATTIVQQALDKSMGLRSAVIAVATAMQESQLQNIGYGDQDSLGLFQQRPSMGWGTAQQILTPKFAADAFLTALAQQQASNPGWVHEPLWATAQSVQKSGFPLAYAKWETQAVHLVKNIVTQVK
jgi:hypothetical protein